MALMFKYYNKQTRLQLKCLGVTAGLQDAVCTVCSQRLDFYKAFDELLHSTEGKGHCSASINSMQSTKVPCNKTCSESINSRKHIQHVYPAPSERYTNRHQGRGAQSSLCF